MTGSEAGALLLEFQTLIGILQTPQSSGTISLYKPFQTLIGILQTAYRALLLYLKNLFQTLIGILQTTVCFAIFVFEMGFQTLIGILQTGQNWAFGNFCSLVSNPYRYSTNIRIVDFLNRHKKLFQTLIGILQTALFLALFKLLSSF